MYVGNDRGGGGGLLSTASDLVIWNDALTNGRLGAFVTEKLQEPATLNNGRKLSYARGLIVDTYRGGKLVWHSGGAAGYSTSRAVFRNTGSPSPSCAMRTKAPGRHTRSRIFDLFLPPAAASEANAAAANAGAPAAPGDLSGRAGLFFNEQTGQPLRLAVNNNTLAIAGGGPLVAAGRRPFPQPARICVFHVGGRVRIAIPVSGPVRDEDEGRRNDTVSPRPALYAHRGRPEGFCRPLRKRRVWQSSR